MRAEDEKVAILLVDDRRDKLLALETILGELDERLVMVTSGEDALRAILREDFAVIILDVNMPGMDGFETAAVIRQRKRTEHTPIIFVTGINVNENHVSRGYSLGAVDYIFTPVDSTILKSKVSVFTDLFRRTKQIRAQEASLRKAAEERAASLQSRLEGLLNRLNVGVFQIDSSGRCLDCNPAFLDALGIRSLEDMDHINLSWIRDQVKIGEASETTVRITRLDGSPLWVALSTSPGFVDGEPVIEGVIEDVTAEKEGQEALRLSEQRYKSLIEALPQLVWTSDAIGSWDYVSRQWCDYTGLEPSEQLHDHWIGLLHPEDEESTVAKWRLAVEHGEVFDVEHRLRGRDETYRWFKTRAVPLFDENGKVLRWFGTCTDFQDQKQAAGAIEETSRLKDEFLTMLSHELRNPLNAISSAAQIALRKPTPEVQTWSMEVVRRQVKHLVRLIDDLLDVSRITHGKIRLRREAVLLNDLIKTAAGAALTAINKRDHQLVISVCDSVTYILGDSARIEQIIVNLLTNAAKYTERGGKIWLSVETSGKDVTITVRDTGIGIAPEMLPRIFDLFSQADRSLDRSQGGLGIGLTVARKLAELHGGTVTASSEGIGKGATFSLHLQGAITDPPARAKPSAINGRTFKPGLKVLLVDDHVDTLEGTALYLTELGCMVRTCSDGLQALGTAREFQPKLVLLDIGLPGLNGYEVARQFRKDDKLKDAILVAVSGYGQEQDKRASRESGFNMHMVKPLDLDLLFPALLPMLKELEGGVAPSGTN